jgi:hypothetical protein
MARPRKHDRGGAVGSRLALAAPSEWPLFACAVRRRRFPVTAHVLARETCPDRQVRRRRRENRNNWSEGPPTDIFPRSELAGHVSPKVRTPGKKKRRGSKVLIDSSDRLPRYLVEQQELRAKALDFDSLEQKLIQLAETIVRIDVPSQEAWEGMLFERSLGLRMRDEWDYWAYERSRPTSPAGVAERFSTRYNAMLHRWMRTHTHPWARRPYRPSVRGFGFGLATDRRARTQRREDVRTERTRDRPIESLLEAPTIKREADGVF